MSSLIAYIDGGSLGNPGPAGIGVVIDGSDNGTIRIDKAVGRQDNNVAEYLARAFPDVKVDDFVKLWTKDAPTG